MVALKENRWQTFERTGNFNLSTDGRVQGLRYDRDSYNTYDISAMRVIDRTTREIEIDFLSNSVREPERIAPVSQRLLQPEPTKLPSTEPRLERLAQPAERAVREHFVCRIAAKLQQISLRAGQSTASPLASDLFFMMRDFANQSPADPFTDVIMALHDALAANDFWTEAQATQYTGAAAVIEKLLSRGSVTDRSVDNAIADIEAIGFDTTPFGITV